MFPILNLVTYSFTIVKTVHPKSSCQRGCTLARGDQEDSLLPFVFIEVLIVELITIYTQDYCSTSELYTNPALKKI